jgi:hypothetical protein
VDAGQRSFYDSTCMIVTRSAVWYVMTVDETIIGSLSFHIREPDSRNTIFVLVALEVERQHWNSIFGSSAWAN